MNMELALGVQELEGEIPRPEIHSRIVECGKREASAGEMIRADMKPHWLLFVLATMCAVEEHGKSGGQNVAEYATIDEA